MSPARTILHAFADEAEPARALAHALGIDCAIVEVHAFPDGELLPTVPETAPTTIVYRSLERPNDKLIPLLLACDAWRRAGARRLILVAPYLCYLRQDAVFSPRQPNSQMVIGELLGDKFDHIVTVDAHLHRTHSISVVFPQTTATDLSAAPAIAAWLMQTRADLAFVIGPDVESEPWVKQVAAAMKTDYRLLNKTRLGDADVRLTLQNASEFSGRAVALVDDICSSGGTLIKAAELLRAAGARAILACITHALFDASVEQRLRAAGVTAIASTDAVLHPTNAISLAPLLANALRTETTP